MILLIRFENEGEAYNFLEALEQIIELYGCITIADVYDMEISENPLLEISGRMYTENQYGWISLKSAKVIFDKGWTVELPRPLYIN